MVVTSFLFVQCSDPFYFQGKEYTTCIALQDSRCLRFDFDQSYNNSLIIVKGDFWSQKKNRNLSEFSFIDVCIHTALPWHYFNVRRGP